MASGHPDDFKEWPGTKMITSEKAMSLGIIGGGDVPTTTLSGVQERTAFVTPESHEQFWRDNAARAGFRTPDEGYTVLGTIE